MNDKDIDISSTDKKTPFRSITDLYSIENLAKRADPATSSLCDSTWRYDHSMPDFSQFFGFDEVIN